LNYCAIHKQDAYLYALNHLELAMKTSFKYIFLALLCYLSFSYLGCKKDQTVFNIIAPSAGDTTTLIGRSGLETGDSARNSVFLDLSKNVQTTVARSAWDLGFYSGTGYWRAIINHSNGATITATDKTDLRAVTQADSTSALATSMSLTDLAGTASTVDPVTGVFGNYIAGTRIDTVYADATLNKVYILNRGRSLNFLNRPWLKFKITRSGNRYTVNYGALAQTEFNILEVTKDATYNFKYGSFSSTSVSIEPAKTLWDIEWGKSTYKDAAGTVVTTPDFVLINFANNVTAAKVPTSSYSFSAFTKADMDALNPTFSAERDAIGTSWFIKSDSRSGLNINTSQFYLIKDAEGNIYKLNFAGGSRGNPIVHYILIHSGTDT
jgi:hypothetical protein